MLGTAPARGHAFTHILTEGVGVGQITTWLAEILLMMMVMTMQKREYNLEQVGVMAVTVLIS